MSLLTNIGRSMGTRRGVRWLVIPVVLVAATSVWSHRDSGAGSEFAIALAGLEHDESGEYRTMIAEAIRGVPNTRIVRAGQIVSAPTGSHIVSERDGHQEAHRLLKTLHADAVIWGAVLSDGDETRVYLHWTPAPDLAVSGTFNRYAAIEDLSLPPMLWDDMDPVLRLLVATYAVDLRASDRKAAEDVFFPYVVPVYDTLARPSEGLWNEATGTRVVQVVANALFRFAVQTDQPGLLEDAVDTYRNVLAGRARWREPLEWARAESNLGGALAALGERLSDTTSLRGAVDAFRAALWELSPDRTPLPWAQTQIKLGDALTALGTRKERDVSTAYLEEAATAYRAALTDQTRARMPLTWAVAQNNLGSVLAALGVLNADLARTEEAVAAYRAALTVESRRRIPQHWATLQANLASVLARLGEARSDPELLKEAVIAYRAALKERPREEMPLAWAATQNNMGNALRILGQIQSDTAQLQRAADAYTAALAEFTRAKSEPQIDTTKRNLERTLKTINERTAS